MDAALLHRYALAAELCAGLRVLDVGGAPEGAALVAAAGATVRVALPDAEAVELAEREHDQPGLFFEVAAFADALRRADPDDADAVLALDAAAPDAAQLGRLAAAGVRLLIAAPGSQPLRLPGARRLIQHRAQGSVLAPVDGGEPLGGRVELWGERAPEDAAAELAAVNFDATVLARASARLEVVATVVPLAELDRLRRANRELERANRELARGVLGKHDAAAAAASAAYDERVEELETRAWILGEEKRMAEARVAQLEAWRDAARYRAVDRAVLAVRRVPVLYPAVKGARRAVRRRRPRG